MLQHDFGVDDLELLAWLPLQSLAVEKIFFFCANFGR